MATTVESPQDRSDWGNSHLNRMADAVVELQGIANGGSISYIDAGSSFAAVQAAITAAVSGDIVVLKPGAYDFGTSTLLVPSGVRVWAYGATIASSAIAAGYPNGGTVRFDSLASSVLGGFSGSPISLALTVDTTEGALTVTVSTSDAAKVSSGDPVEISDTSTLVSVNNHRERNVVYAVNTGTGVITLAWPLNFAYTVANSAALAPLTGAQAVATDTQWLGGTINLSGAASGTADGIIGVYADRSLVADLIVKNHRGMAVEFWACVDTGTERISAYTPSAVAAGNGYGTRLQYCRFCHMRDTYGQNVRHIMDMTGGSDNTGSGVYGGGRTTDTTQCGAFLHGLESKRCRYENVKVTNMVNAIGGGNGSFGADYDFTFTGLELNQCDDAVLITQNSTGWRVSDGVIFNSNIRGISTNVGCSGDIEDITIDGILTNPSSFGALDINTQAGDIVTCARVTVKRPIFRCARIAGAGDIYLHDANLQQSGVSTQPALAYGSFTGRFVMTGGVVYAVNPNSDALFLSGAAALTLIDDVTIVGSGTMSAGIHVLGGPTIGIVRNCHVISTGEGIRVESPNCSVYDNTIVATSNQIRTNGTVTSIYLAGNRFLGAGTKITNTAAAAIVTESGTTGAIPTADPHIPGQLWSNAGTITISAG